MQSQRSYQQLASTLSELKNQKANLYLWLHSYGFLGSLTTLRLTPTSIESLSARNTLSTVCSEISSQIQVLRKLLSQYESLIGNLEAINSKNLNLLGCGKNYQPADIDGCKTANCPLENFEQLETDLYPGMP